MRAGYYSWDLDGLIDWLDLERPKYDNPIAFAKALGVSLDKLKAWTVQRLPTIELEDLNALAKYRQASLQSTADWLGITPNHLYMLFESKA